MKKISFALIIVFLILSNYGISQEQKGKCFMEDEKIKSEKIAFISDRLNLTVKEAQDFWPVYNEFTSKMDNLFVEEHKIMRALKSPKKTLSDKELETKLDRLFAIKDERTKLENQYYQKFKQILPIQKVAAFYQTEREFRRYLLQKYKDRPPCPED